MPRESPKGPFITGKIRLFFGHFPDTREEENSSIGSHVFMGERGEKEERVGGRGKEAEREGPDATSMRFVGDHRIGSGRFCCFGR